jgi:hypothetical protein
MRPLAGPAMLLVMVGGFAIYKFMGKDPTPPRAFTELELASADAEHTGTCYALSTVLVANGVFGNAVRTWSAPDEKNDDKWTLTVESVQQAYKGPAHVFQTFTFVRSGEQIRLDSVEASEGLPTEIAANIDRLLEAPHGMKSTPVDRCQKDGATGYRFPPHK